MATRIGKAIELIHDIAGVGPKATKGCSIIFNARFFLRQGEEVTRNAHAIAMCRDQLPTRVVEDVELIDHVTTLGKRQPIAAVEKTLCGRQASGYREILASPHLCYAERGVTNLVPPRAMLRMKLGSVSQIAHRDHRLWLKASALPNRV